jgi:seryl-tRNA synthetase
MWKSQKPVPQIAFECFTQRRKTRIYYVERLRRREGAAMTAKDYLSQAYRIDQRINSKIEQVQSLRALAEKASMTLSDVFVKKTRNIRRMEDIITKMADMETEINADLERLVDLKHEIVTVIKCVAVPQLQTLLELRYLCFRSWEEIAVSLHHDIRWIHRLHHKALNEVDAIRHCTP